MQTKKCTSCNSVKELKEFNKNSSRKDGLQTKCRMCDRKRALEYFNSNQVQKEKAKLRTKERLKENQDLICEFLSKNPCVDCNESNIILLEFDHKNPEEKVECITVMVTNGFSFSKIKQEIEKCEIRCISCHKKRTAIQQNNYRLKWLLNNNAS